MSNYIEGNTYTIGGKKKIYQPDGTFRDASVNAPPEPANYIEPTPAAPTKNVSHTAVNENPANPGTTTYYADGTSSFSPTQVNANGLTSAQMTAKANAQTPTVTPTTTTTGTPTVTYNPDGTRTLTGTQKDIAEYYNSIKPKSQAEIDESNEKIRQQNLERQQAEIDAVNAMYANILNQIRVDNQGRMNSTQTIEALSGERGSKSGAADVEKTRKYNESVVAAANAEKANTIAAIMSKYQTKIDNSLEQARKDRETDANSWITYQNNAVARKKIDATNLRKELLSAGIEPADIDENTWQQIADAGGYTVPEAKALYGAEFKRTQAAYVNNEATALADLTAKQLANSKTEAEIKKLLSEASNNAQEQEDLLIKAGYIYMSTPAQRDEYKKKGRLMTTVNGRTYMAPIERDPNATTTSSNSGTKNYTSTTIPVNLKQEILTNKAAGATMDQIMTAYPEVSTSYIQQLYGKTNIIIN